MILGSLLLLVNIFGFVNFLFNMSGFFSGIGTGSPVQQLSYMIAGRQLAVTVVFALALFGKIVRFMQLAWFLAIIREISDAAGTMALGMTAGTISIIVLVIVELRFLSIWVRLPQGMSLNISHRKRTIIKEAPC